MSLQLTLEQVVHHNTQSAFDKYAVIHSEIYRLAQMPWDRCTATPDMVTGLMMAGPDISPLFPRLASGRDGSDLTAVKSATGSHIGTLVQAHAEAHHGQPEAQHNPQVAQSTPFSMSSLPGQWVSSPVSQNSPPGANNPPGVPPGQAGAHSPPGVPPGQAGAHSPPGANNPPGVPPGQAGAHSPQGHGGQHHQQPVDAQREAKEKAAAEKKRREEARKRRLRKTYNPLQQDPDDADEYPADAVAMGYLPDLDARRWRERRMRLNRFIQFMDTQNIDDTDVNPTLSKYLHLDFANKIVYKRHLRGGEAKGCTGAFRASRPPPPRAQMRPRRQLPLGRQSPGPRDPPDSDDSDDSDDGGGGGGQLFGPVMRGTEGRVRPWAASASNLPDQQPTPPVTPAGPAGQNTQGQATQPPPRPPQDPHELTPEEEQAIARQNRQKEKAAADKVLLERAHQERLAAWAREDSNAKNQANIKKQQQYQKDEAERKKQQEETRKRQQDAAKKRDELRKRKEEQQKAQKAQETQTTRKQPETSKQNQQLLNLKTAREEREQAIRKAEERLLHDKQKQNKEAELAKKQASTASLGQHHHHQAQQFVETTRKQAEEAEKTRKELEAAEQRAEQRKTLENQQDQEKDERNADLARKQKAAASGFTTPVSGRYRDQVQRIKDFIASSMTPEEAREAVAQQDNGLVDSTGRIIQLPKGGKAAGGGNRGRKTLETPGPPMTPEKQRIPATTTPQGPKRNASKQPRGQGPGKRLQTSSATPTPASDLALLYGVSPPRTTDPDDTVDIYNQPLPPGIPEPSRPHRSPDPIGDFYTAMFASMPPPKNLMDVDSDEASDDEDQMGQEFVPTFGSSSKATETPASQARPAPPVRTNVNYTRVPEVRLPDELFPDYTGDGAVPKKFPPPGGIPTAKSSPDSGRVSKKTSPTAGSSLRPGKARQNRQTRR